uniref:Uncharacterized protein n=1 Tax=Arundo donax TaxID=35708 RepID=A0A0A9B322_ARUDO
MNFIFVPQGDHSGFEFVTFRNKMLKLSSLFVIFYACKHVIAFFFFFDWYKDI